MYVQLKLRIRSAGDRLQGDDQIPPELLSRLDQVSHTPVPVTAAFLRRCVVILYVFRKLWCISVTRRHCQCARRGSVRKNDQFLQLTCGFDRSMRSRNKPAAGGFFWFPVTFLPDFLSTQRTASVLRNREKSQNKPKSALFA